MPNHRGNAYGKGSPPESLPFHKGKATAAEIMTYIPHSLKSINVVDRFITNGGGASLIAAMVNEFRHVPQGAVFSGNSVGIMMSHNMRRAGFVDWIASKHDEWVRPEGHRETDDLYVGDYSTKFDTHRTHQLTRRVRGVAFKSLGLHVKKHPSGDDALDLARCVQYAMSHPDIDYEYPRDFVLLTNLTGGPATVTDNHLDLQAFTRRGKTSFTSSTKTLTAKPKGKRQYRKNNKAPRKYIKKESDAVVTQSNLVSVAQSTHFDVPQTNYFNVPQSSYFEVPQAGYFGEPYYNPFGQPLSIPQFGAPPVVESDVFEPCPVTSQPSELQFGELQFGHLHYGIPSSSLTEIPQHNPIGMMGAGDRRKSGRLATKVAPNMREYDSDSLDIDNVDSPYTGTATPAKKRKISRVPPSPGSPDDSDYAVEGISEIDDEIPAGELVSDDEELFFPARGVKRRAAAHKARESIHYQVQETQRNIDTLKRKRSVHLSRAATPFAALSAQGAEVIPVQPMPPGFLEYGAKRIPLPVVNEQILSAASAYDSNAKPAFLAPPNLGGTNNYVSIDESNVRLYSGEDCATEAELWNSAFDYKRFNGPRRHPPLRELHRLVGPEEHDTTEFAENIRWAKQQKLFYNSTTWREYDYDLETITQHRRDVNWVSEQRIMYGE